jgi:hypothetical protein
VAEGFREAIGFSKVLNRLEITQVGLKYFTLNAEAHALPFASELHKARVLQLLYMVGKCGGGDWLALAHIGAEDAFTFSANLLKNLMTARICQCFGDEPDLALRKLWGFRQRLLRLPDRGHVYVYQFDEIRRQKERGGQA